MTRTRRFQHGRFNYSIKYRQFQMPWLDSETGDESLKLFHEEVVKFYEFPFTFGTETKIAICEDTGAYYRS